MRGTACAGRNFPPRSSKTELARAQLHALQLQLQPHFLFNTLHAIGVLNQDDPARATRMIASLGDLLRGSLDNRAAKEITLEKELALLEHYLDIESVRFSDRLTVSVDVPAAVKQYLVPTFSLQPLVENAVRHGVARRVGASLLRIGASAEDGRLRLSVWNNGPAIDLAQIRRAWASPRRVTGCSASMATRADSRSATVTAGCS